MRSKILVTLLIVAVAIGLYSFGYSGEGSSSHTAVVMAVSSKEPANEGYLIQFGDGSTELVAFEIGKYTSSQDALHGAGVAAKGMNKLYEKGYHYVGTANSPNSAGALTYPFMMFEKK